MNRCAYAVFFFYMTHFSMHACHYPWVVIGAGPAGIMSMVILRENGIKPLDIAWIDPEFNVGRMGKYYRNVPSNHTKSRIIDLFRSSVLFNAMPLHSLQKIIAHDSQKEPLLQFLVDPLQEATDFLCRDGAIYYDMAQALAHCNGQWRITVSQREITADKVILALGAHPKKLLHNKGEEIPLDNALDEHVLRTMIIPQDTVVVVGSAHSAILILKYLSEMPVKKVINLYTKPLVYGPLGGLEGIAARWAAAVLEPGYAPMIERIPFSQDSFEKALQVSTKVIYAYGYERNPIAIQGIPTISFDEQTGIIAHNLFGIGIAFPETYTTHEGVAIKLTSVNAFMESAKDLIPQWIKY